MKTVHLICNAHLDPVWLWEWEEGAAEAISTFRTAADFCEKFDGFIFNHNEVILYRWVEEYDPPLFRRIKKLVKEKKWHIMGGWFLQPDCNMPSGESFVRQMLLGRNYFQEKFGVKPTTAINFDSFGHTRGLVQIMVKSGYDSYVFCRPGDNFCKLPKNTFTWEGYDGSKINAIQPKGGYLSLRGTARKKVEEYIQNNPETECGIVLWGIGNHGGGPSKIDLEDLAALMKEREDVKIIHSTPEAYFREIRKSKAKLPAHSKDMNPFAPGCYTSQVRLKQRHRKLENELFMVEKMVSSCFFLGLLPYPQDDLNEAMEDLANSEFHDILPGSSIEAVEESSLRLMDHGLEILSRIKAKAFFALARGEKKSGNGENPVLVLNPHPYPVKVAVECEFQLPDQNHMETFTDFKVYENGKLIPSQIEKESSNLTLDWRKKIVFNAKLKPSQINRFNCVPIVKKSKPEKILREDKGKITFKNDELEVVINTKTGLIDKYSIKGRDYLAGSAFELLAIEDNNDAWGMKVSKFDKIKGRFRLMNRKEAALASGIDAKGIPVVRVIEDGDVRSVVETVLKYGNSVIYQRYFLPKNGTEIGVETRVHWNEKHTMLKLSVPFANKDASVFGQVAFGREELKTDGTEMVSQKWIAVTSKKSGTAISFINNGVYGSSFSNSRLNLTLLRSPAFTGHPIGERQIIEQDRYTPRMDQGERIFKFWMNGGKTKEIMESIDREALSKNEKPYALSFFPDGNGRKTGQFFTLSDSSILATAVKKSEKDNSLILRLFEPTGKKARTSVSIPSAGMRRKVTFAPFEIKTFSIDFKKKKWTETDLMEK